MEKKKKHMYEIDLMRTFVMMGVLTVHTITIYLGQLKDFSPEFMSLATFHSSIHFTRESFMFITGFVVFISYYYRDFNTLRFWWKRLTLIAIPYVAWTVMDDVSDGILHHSLQFLPMMHEILHSLMVADKWHLYYILVSLQFYLVFPFLLYIMRKWERWHIQILIGSFVFELLLMAFYEFGIPHLHTSTWPYFLARLTARRSTFVLTYEFWFIFGAILASHYQPILAFVDRHKKALWITLTAGIALIFAHYWFNRFILGQSNGTAESVEQPFYVPYALLVTISLWYAGVLWSRRRQQPHWQWFSKFIQLGSKTSFGIFLFQIYPLDIVQAVVPRMHVPVWVFFGSIPIAVLFVYFSGMLVSYWIGKIPLLSYLVGHKVKFPRRRQASEISPSA